MTWEENQAARRSFEALDMSDATQVREGVRYIASIADDDEAAHGREDDLRERVLAAIASGAANASDLAREALRTSDIQFSRWCA